MTTSMERPSSAPASTPSPPPGGGGAVVVASPPSSSSPSSERKKTNDDDNNNNNNRQNDLQRLYSVLNSSMEKATIFVKEKSPAEEEEEEDEDGRNSQQQQQQQNLRDNTKTKTKTKQKKKNELKVVENSSSHDSPTTTMTTTTDANRTSASSSSLRSAVVAASPSSAAGGSLPRPSEEGISMEQNKNDDDRIKKDQPKKDLFSISSLKRLDLNTTSSSARNNKKQRRSINKKSVPSMSLRKIPTDILLTPPPNFDDEVESAIEEEKELGGGTGTTDSVAAVAVATAGINTMMQDEEGSYYEDGGDNNNHNHNHNNNNTSTMGGCFFFPSKDWVNALCLSSKFKLRTQLMLSFGSVNIVTIIMVLSVCILVTYFAGENVKQINRNAFTNQLVPNIQALTVRYLAESLEQQFMPIDLINIVEEATQDRIQGYPNSIVQQEQVQQVQVQQVPFKDIVTGRQIYPIIGDPMFLDWQIPSDVTDENYEEHVQESRWNAFYKAQSAVSTTSAVFFYQGVCDPTITDPNSSSYWENCTMANNDISSGGVIHPVPTTEPLYRASNDLMPLIKAIYESKKEIRDIGLLFSSMGAGASFNFPAFPYSTHAYYTSIGCEWMTTINPIDPSLGPIGTREEIERCHPKGMNVSSRVYNPLERGWCRDQALNPQKTFLDAYIDAWNPGHWLLSIGRGFYDRQTNIFLGCSYVGISLSLVEEKLHESLVTENSVLSLIRFDSEGTVLASTAVTALSGATDSDVSTIDELQVGVSLESYQSLYSLVEYGGNQTWEPQSTRKKYEEFSLIDENFLVSVYPMPRVPNEYDPNYKPEFLVVMSTSKDDVFGGVEELNDLVDDHVEIVLWFSLIAGVVGVFATMMILVSMSHTVTSPLHYINQAANDIVNSFGESKGSSAAATGDDDSNNKTDQDDSNINSDDTTKNDTTQLRNNEPNGVKGLHPLGGRFALCTPKTELTDVMIEFNKMVASFSGALLAKSEQGRRIEVRNRFELRKEFADLYASRKDENFAYNFDTVLPEEETVSSDEGDNFRRSDLGFVHLGSNLTQPMSTTGGRSKNKHLRRESKSFLEISRRGSTSRLFLWTVALIVTPLLLTSITISTVVYSTAKKEFRDSVVNAEDYYIGVRLDALSVHAKLRADYVASLVDVSVRDLYLLTRYYGWLLFDGVKRADSFTEIMNGIEECKPYADDFSQCPHIKDNFVCDCAWNDDRSECNNFPYGSRHLQRPQMIVQSTDALPDGDRNFSSYPRASTTPETTVWWDDIKSVPGWEKGSSASGHDTLYDRLRVSSAMPLFPVLYNYDRTDNYIGQYIAFEADGLNIGFAGCNFKSFVGVSRWKSTEENGAAKIRPELCPVGKFGFDPRCREWYDTGRRLAIERDFSLHMTAPYIFVTDVVAQTATSPLIDPRTGEYVAQVAVDFFSTSIFEALDDENTPLTNGGFPVLIAVQGDPSKDTVKGPGFAVGDAPKEVSEVIQPTDVEQFRTVVASMKEGDTKANSFTKVGRNGKGTDTVHISYAPVVVRNIHPVNSSNFASGIRASDYLIYSLGLCETREGLLEPFAEIEKDMNRQIVSAIVILTLGILLAALLIIYISCLVTTSIANPMLDLLDLIRRINRSNFDGGPPKIDHSLGSQEIRNVSDTVIVLYKIVRAANDFFFSGELEKAYVVLVDALRLFRRLGNKKAVAVVSNNLGNTMLAIYREMQSSGDDTYCGLTKEEIISHGTGHFHEAITLGEKAYDEFMIREGWTPNCLDFMQHLSNRYFNRALFLLMVKDDHDQPQKIVELGLRDLVICRDMDTEIVEYGQDIGFNRENRSHKLFHVDLIRSRGHNMLLQMGYPNEYMKQDGYPDDWRLGERLDDYFKLLQTENQRDGSEVFKDVNVLGRLQEIETELMKYKMLTKDVETAAQIAIRVLMEDQVVFVETLSAAVDVLLVYVDTTMANDLDTESLSRVKDELLSYTKWLDTDLESLTEDARLTRGSTLGSTLDSLSEEVTSRIFSNVESESTSPKRNASRRLDWVKKQASGGFVTMEDF